MGQHFAEIPPFLIEWILKQKLFWVASAPLKADGHVNLSPKSVSGTFHVVNKNKIWYEDLTGSGVETVAHLRENGRITVMFHAFDGPPRIVRLWGQGTVHEFGTPEYEQLIPTHERKPGSRCAIVVDVYKVGTSCGYTIPIYEFKYHRTKLLDWCSGLEKSDAEAAEGATERASTGLKAYWTEKNTQSLDGLPGLTHAHVTDTVPRSRLEAGKEGAEVGGGGVWPEKVELGVKGTKDRNEIKLAAAFMAGVAAASIYVKVFGSF